MVLLCYAGDAGGRSRSDDNMRDECLRRWKDDQMVAQYLDEARSGRSDGDSGGGGGVAVESGSEHQRVWLFGEGL